MPESEPTKMFNKAYAEPDGDELPRPNELKKEPYLLQFHLTDHAPGIIKWYECFPAFNIGLLNMPYIPTCQPMAPTIKTISPVFIVLF